jgi:hypothetical protein
MEVGMRALLVGCVVAAAAVVTTRSSTGEPRRSAEYRLTTLFKLDPLRSAISLADGADGNAIENRVVVDRESDLDFGNFNVDSLTVGIQSGRRGVLVDLGTQEALARRYGYAETVGMGQGFASIHLEDGRAVIRRPSDASSVQPLRESTELFGLGVPSATRPAIAGHVYLARVIDERDRAFERIAKILVVAHVPGESVTLRWALL